MSGKISQLSSSELASLSISKLIFHVLVQSNEDEPLQYLDAPLSLTPSQRDFFVERLRQAASGTQYIFTGIKQPLRDLCEELVQHPSDFVENTKAIAESFSRHHRGRQMAPGVIVVATATVTTEGKTIPLVFILKMDHQKAMTYNLKLGHDGVTAQMQEYADALVQDKAAVQRHALIDLSDTFAWDVLASERSEGTTPNLKNFFKAFLGVELREDPSVLTRRTFDVVKMWTRQLPLEDRPDDEDPGRYHERAIQYLKDNDTFSAENFINTVVRDPDGERKARASALLNEMLAEHGVSGQTFEPMPESIRKSLRETRMTTDEGVEISYEGARENARIEIRPDPDGGPHAVIITIHTSHLAEKNT